MSECRVVAEIEAESRLVEEYELAGDPEFQLAFFSPQLLGDLRQLGECLLYGAVFERVQLDRAQSLRSRQTAFRCRCASWRGRSRAGSADGLADRVSHDHILLTGGAVE